MSSLYGSLSLTTEASSSSNLDGGGGINLDVSPSLTTSVCTGERGGEKKIELLQHFSHKHPLNLSLFQDAKCWICGHSVSDGPIYRCSSSITDCNNFFLHKSCAELPQKFLTTLHPPHPLELSNPTIGVPCDGCVKPIFVPFYTCADQCDFSLHKQCFELPNKIQHPLHHHLLTLQAKANLSENENKFGVFRCYICRVICNGFTYSCGKCVFLIDVGCSLLSNPLRHEGHQCALNLVGKSDKECECSACGLDCYSKFICEQCNFNLDFRCASLPKTISHDCPKPTWRIRPFKLTYGSVVDELGEYYCDVCEKHRGQNHWFYYCEDCDYSAHPRCMLKEYLIKFGKTNLAECHQHSLTLVKEAKDNGSMGCPPCAICASSCTGLGVLFCAECNIYIHHRDQCCGFGWVRL